jgi:hypothetical protein
MGVRLQHPIEEVQQQLFKDLMYLTSKKCAHDCKYFHKFQDLQMQLSKLNYFIADWQLVAILSNKVLKPYKKFIEHKIEEQHVSKNKVVELKINTVINPASWMGA